MRLLTTFLAAALGTGVVVAGQTAADPRDNFKAGTDIDAISRATISVTSSARAIRNSARRVARALLTPPPVAHRSHS